ncbi:hypothetical protein [Microcoleus sp. POL10_C6]
MTNSSQLRSPNSTASDFCFLALKQKNPFDNIGMMSAIHSYAD